MSTWESLGATLNLPLAGSELLQKAVTHSSAVPDAPQDSNERLEFLGDAVLGLIIAEAMHHRYPGRPEGDLAQMKSYIVSEEALGDAALRWGLDTLVRLGAGEATNGGTRRRSILSDAFEAMLAAIYLEFGLEQVQRVALEALEPAILSVESDKFRHDHKSALQVITQSKGRGAPAYTIVSTEGREHERVYTVQAALGTDILGEGSGSSKKAAEQAAALVALGNLEAASPVTTANEHDAH